MRKNISLYILLLLCVVALPHQLFAQFPPFGLPNTTTPSTTIPQGATGLPNTMGYPNPTQTQGANIPSQTGTMGAPNTQGLPSQAGYPNANGLPQTGTPPNGFTQGNMTGNVPLPVDTMKQLPDYEQRMKELLEKGVSEKQLQPNSKKTQDSLLNALKDLNKPTTPTSIGPKLPKNTAVFTRLDSTVVTRINQDTVAFYSFNSDSARFDTLIYINTKKKTTEQLLASAVFGHHLFLKPSKPFANLDTSAFVPTDEYIIQPGDEFGVSAWNDTYISEFLRVESDGTVSRQYVGKVFVGGLSYKDARTILEKAYSKFLPDGARIKVRLVKNARTQNAVTVVGEVKQDGTFYLPPYATVFDALQMAGGINELGTVRNIYIKRSGKIVKTLDLYDYLIKGNVESIFLKNGDYVFVPIAGDIVRIRGSVKRPLRYEMKENESLHDLVRFAGGFASSAYTSNLKITRYENDQKNILNVDYRANSKLYDGDIVDVSMMSSEVKNFVEIKGSVIRPETYEFRPGMDVKELLRLAGGTNKTAYLDKAYIVRIPKIGKIEYLPVNLNVENPKLQTMDLLVVLDDTIFNQRKYIQVFGEVRKAGKFQTSPKMTLKDVLYLVEGLKENAKLENVELGYFTSRGSKDPSDPNAVNERNGEDTPNTASRRVSIQKDWQNDPSLDTVLIRDFRYLKVYSKFDYVDEYKINVVGAIRKKGAFKLNKTMTLKDVFYLVGGLKEDANYENIELGYYEYKGKDAKDPNVALDTKDGSLPLVETKTRRISIKTDWEKDEQLDTILVHKYRYVKVYSRYEDYITKSIKTSGAFKKTRTLQTNPTMTLKDLFYLSGGFDEYADLSSIELRYYKGLSETDVQTANFDELPKEGATLRIVSANEDWRNDPALDTILVSKYNFVQVYSKDNFVLKRTLSVSGIVQKPQSITLSKGMTLKDVFYLCEGLKVSDETTHWVDLYYYIPIQDRGNLNMKAETSGIRRLQIGKDWRNDARLDTILTYPFEKVVVHGQNEFIFTGQAEVKGVVNTPSKFNVAPKMTLKDVLYLGGGVKLETDYNNIEISRVLKLENTNGQVETTPVIMQKIVISQDWQNDTKLDSIFIYPFDIIYVRPNPNFKLQQNVSIEGEINVPGEYPKLRSNERISSLVKRAGGISKVGFPEGAKLIRKINPIWEVQKQGRLQSILQKERLRFLQAEEKAAALDKNATTQESTITTNMNNNQEAKLAQEFKLEKNEQMITIQLDKAIKRPGGRYDLMLQEGDRIIIPPAKQTVEIRGNVLDSTSIVVFDRRNTSFKNYVNLAGGFGKRTDKNECVVIYPNGTSRKAERILLWHKYPKVTDGAVIYVPRKPDNKGQSFASQFAQFGPTLKELTADAMSILSLILLVRTLTQ